jgi:hypothetical protein
MLTFFDQRHAFHLVDPSAMPFITAISVLTMVTGGAMYFHGYVGGIEMVAFAISTLVCMFL